MANKELTVLAFETSCDDTCASVVQCSKNSIKVLSNVVSSQIDIHKLYGGVVPEIASRNHALAIQTVYEEALQQAGVTLNEITHIAATVEPGLRGAVMVGRVFAESLATARNLPFVPVNHLAGHIASITLSHPEVKPPFTTLLVSGGHTSLYHVEGWQDIKLLCETCDDACGEAFDKVAKLLGLPYPGGVSIEKLLTQNTSWTEKDFMQFVQNPNFHKPHFTYSGLKTAVLNYVRKHEKKADFQQQIPHIVASFQHEAVEQLVVKCIENLSKTGNKILSVCGGVSANKYLRKRLSEECEKIGVKVLFPEFKYCTDNAAMIAAASILNVML